jgi:glycosyltransferase involved in cell wall biosynthesis
VRPPTFSVVIPTHGGRFVVAAIASVVGQTVEDWELVVVDDGSRDGTAQLLAVAVASEARIRLVTLQSNAGIVAARNRGLGSISATSTYVAFLDHDDLWMPNTLELLQSALGARPAASAAHGTAIEIDGYGRPRHTEDGEAPARRMGLSGGRLMPWPSDRPTEFANLVYEDCVRSMGSGLIRRAALDRVGWFDPRAERADDYDLWIRLSRIGPIAFVDREVLGYRLHEGQTSHRPPQPRGRGIGYVRYKMITSPENTPEQRRLAIEGFRARQQQFLGERWSDLLTAWKRREYSDVPKRLAQTATGMAAYARGRPWSWHR